MSKKTQSNGWERAEVNVRLTKRRLQILQALRGSLPADASPTDAMDRALGSALHVHGKDDSLADLRDAMEQRAMEQRFEVDRLEDAISRLGEKLDSLHALISAAAQSDEF